MPARKSATAAFAFIVIAVIAPPKPFRAATSNAHPVSTVMLTVMRNSAIADVTRPWSEETTGRIDMFINGRGPLKLLEGWTAVASAAPRPERGFSHAVNYDSGEYAAVWSSGQQFSRETAH